MSSVMQMSRAALVQEAIYTRTHQYCTPRTLGIPKWQSRQNLTADTLSWRILTVPALVTEIGQSLQDASVQKVNGSSAKAGRSM